MLPAALNDVVGEVAELMAVRAADVGVELLCSLALKSRS